MSKILTILQKRVGPTRWTQINCCGTATTPDADSECKTRVRGHGLTRRAADCRAVSRALGRGWTITEVDGYTYDRCPAHQVEHADAHPTAG